jgi:hypothetical protein
LLLDIIWSLEDVDVQSSTDMPCNTGIWLELTILGMKYLLAMEWPNSWIILSPLKYNISRSTGIFSSLNKLHISLLSIAWVSDLSVPGTNTLSQDVEVVTVKLYSSVILLQSLV